MKSVKETVDHPLFMKKEELIVFCENESQSAPYLRGKADLQLLDMAWSPSAFHSVNNVKSFGRSIFAILFPNGTEMSQLVDKTISVQKKKYFSSDIENLNKTNGRVFTNFDPVNGSETLFRSHRHEVFILKKPEIWNRINETFVFSRQFARSDSITYLGRKFVNFFVKRASGYARICVSDSEETAISLGGRAAS